MFSPQISIFLALFCLIFAKYINSEAFPASHNYLLSHFYFSWINNRLIFHSFHYLFKGRKWSCSVVSNSFRSHCGLPGLSVHGIFPGKTTGVSCHFLLQEIFPTQGLNQVSRIVGRRFIVSATREVPQPPALGIDALSIRPLGHHPLSMYLFLFFLVQSIQRHMPPSVFFSRCSNISENSSNLVFLKPSFLKSPLHSTSDQLLLTLPLSSPAGTVDSTCPSFLDSKSSFSSFTPLLCCLTVLFIHSCIINHINTHCRQTVSDPHHAGG